MFWGTECCALLLPQNSYGWRLHSVLPGYPLTTGPTAEAQLWWHWAIACISWCWGQMHLHQLCAMRRRAGQQKGRKSGNLCFCWKMYIFYSCHMHQNQRTTAYIFMWLHTLFLCIFNSKNAVVKLKRADNDKWKMSEKLKDFIQLCNAMSSGSLPINCYIILIILIT